MTRPCPLLNLSMWYQKLLTLRSKHFCWLYEYTNQFISSLCMGVGACNWGDGEHKFNNTHTPGFAIHLRRCGFVGFIKWHKYCTIHKAILLNIKLSNKSLAPILCRHLWFWDSDHNFTISTHLIWKLEQAVWQQISWVDFYNELHVASATERKIHVTGSGFVNLDVCQSHRHGKSTGCTRVVPERQHKFKS